MSFGAQEIITRDMLQMEESRLYDVGAERGFLACIIRQPDLIQSAEQSVAPGDVYVDIHAYVYMLMRGIYAKVVSKGWNLSFDAISMVNLARSQGGGAEERFYRRTDGMNKVRELEQLSHHIDINNFGNFVAILNDRSARVSAYRHARTLQESLLDLRINPEVSPVLIQAESHLAGLAFRTSDDESKITKLSDQAPETEAKIWLNRQYPELGLYYTHCPTFPRWMHMLGGGIYRKNLTIIQARPKVGKSTLLAQVLIDTSRKHRCPGLFIDNEMSREEVYTRELSSMSKWKQQDILAGRMFDEGTDTTAINHAINELASLPIYYINVAEKPTSYILAALRQFRNHYVGYKTLEYRGQMHEVSHQAITVFDWLKIPDPTSLGKNVAEHQALGQVANALKRGVSMLDLSMVAAGQHNRDATKFKTSKDWADNAGAATGGSDRFNQFAGAVCDLRNVTSDEASAIGAKFQNPGNRQDRSGRAALLFDQIMHIPYNRNGPTCSHGIPMYHDKGRFRYEEISDPNNINGGFASPAVEAFLMQQYEGKRKRGTTISDGVQTAGGGPDAPQHL